MLNIFSINFIEKAGEFKSILKQHRPMFPVTTVIVIDILIYRTLKALEKQSKTC